MKKLNLEKWVRSRCVYQGKIFSVRFGFVRLADHTIVDREIIEHSGGAAALPVFDDGSVMLVRQFRIAVGQVILELPGGRLNAGETPELCARRELEEEVGVRAGEMSRIVDAYCSPGFTNQRNTIFIASKLKKTRRRPEQDETVVPITLTKSEVVKGLSCALFKDANTIIALQAYLGSF